MFKALVLTQKLIKHPYSTLNRQIISQTKESVQYSPQRSPIKNQNSLSNIQKHINNEKSISSHNEVHSPLKISEIEGNLKLFHQYQLQRIQDNFNQLIIEKKKQQIAALAHLKTNILAIVNISSLQQKIVILNRLSQIKDQIVAVDIFIEINESKNNSIKNYNIVVYFQTSLMSQEFYKLCYNQFTHLPIYLKEVIILQRQTSDEISYKDVLSSFRYIEPLSQHQQKLSLSQKQIEWFKRQQRQWIQLPKCVNCLLKLEFQVTGIDQKLLYLLSETKKDLKQQKTIKQNTSNRQECSTCQILVQHRKQSDIHRKLSFESDNKEHSKSQNHAHCDDCKQKSDIWICMVCSRVGCGRYKNADAYKHFVKSGHIITIDLQTQRVWNYLSDCFSHKLLKHINEAASNVRFPDLNKDQCQKIEQSKLEAAFWQYCSVFSQQMQRQRIFYQNIKSSQEQKFQLENEKLQKIIKELQKQSEEKSLQLRKSLKKKSKILKRKKQIEQKVIEQRQILKQHEQCLSADFLKNLIQNDEDIVNKKRQLQALELQLNQVLIQLSNE